MKNAVLFHFPYAGASTVSFKDINRYISRNIEVVCIEYAGHGKRIEEPFADSVISLARDAFLQIAARKDQGPIYLSGHCLGALAAYEAYHLMIKEGIQEEISLIISGQGSPDEIISENLQNMSEEELLPYLVEHGLVDQALTDPRYRGYVKDLILKPIINDSLIYDRYINEHTETIDSTIHILYGMEDGRYPLEKLEGWKHYTKKSVELYPFNGDHYFIRQYEKEYFEKINEIMNNDLEI